MEGVFSRLLLCTSIGLLIACSDNSDFPTNTPILPTPEPLPVTLMQETVDLPSAAQPAHTPGSPGVVVNNPLLITQFHSAEVDLNKARYTRYFLSDSDGRQPDAILVMVPGFEGGASNFFLLANALLRRAQAENSLTLEVWAMDRRSNQLEDTVGLDVAEDLDDPQVGLDFLFGEELGLTLSQPLMDGPNRRAVFYNNNSDTAFIAQWTPLVHSLDIDAIVQQARDSALNSNVFLGGHSAGTGYTARYAATDFNLSGGEPEPGFGKLRGLILLEGGGASNRDTPPDEATLDLIEARFDGGLFGAVRDQAPRCIDGQTACSVETEATDCAAFSNHKCVRDIAAFSDFGGLLSPQLLAVSEVTALDSAVNGEETLSILQREHNSEPGNTAIDKVPGLAGLKVLLGNQPSSSISLLGQFLDDDGIVAALASFVSTSIGFPGPIVNGISTWLTGDDEIPIEAFVDNGPPPQSLDEIRRWGLEVEPSDLRNILPMFYRGQTNFSDWYYPSSGLGVVSGLGLDTSPLSAPPPLGRGRTDIDNRTQGGMIDIPVIAFGGSNGLTPTPASWRAFASSITTCTTLSCDGVTPRLVDADNPSPAFPSYGDISGGFEVYMSEGYAHFDILSAEDDETNNVIAPLLVFVARHLE
ncbi:MAG: pimeloyl-ACP methyl ester carboxylesterase [Halieaceae bacterium]|jgi:pimeloyl-ACP methyl ester carboxylesterase